MRVLSSVNVLVLAVTVFPLGCASTRGPQQTDAMSPQAAPDAVILVKGMT